MKKHLFTAALAIVAIGAAVAGTATKPVSESKLTTFTYYQSPNCNTPITCDTEAEGPACTNLVGPVYQLPGCSNQTLSPQGNLPID
jgi:hypothetical protein